MADLGSRIPGVEWGHIRAHADDRGAFREIWRASTFPAPAGSFAQANLSRSERGVLRGLHYHRRQLDHWVVLEGEVFVALIDLRRAISEDVPRPATRVLTEDDTVTIPEMVAHGFLALEPTSLLYLVTNEYDGTDELGLAWDDPEIGVPWPLVATGDGRPILSDRDRGNPSFAELRGRQTSSR